MTNVWKGRHSTAQLKWNENLGKFENASKVYVCAKVKACSKLALAPSRNMSQYFSHYIICICLCMIFESAK